MPQTYFLYSLFLPIFPPLFIPLPWTLLNRDYFFFHPPLFSSPLPSSAALLAFAHYAGGGVFWLPAKLMSKCHPHATVIQISYFLLFLVQTSHPSRLSPSLTPSRQAPSFPFSVCCRKASNEIHTKQDGKRHAFLTTFLTTFLCLFLFIFAASQFGGVVFSSCISVSCPRPVAPRHGDSLTLSFLLIRFFSDLYLSFPYVIIHLLQPFLVSVSPRLGA